MSCRTFPYRATPGEFVVSGFDISMFDTRLYSSAHEVLMNGCILIWCTASKVVRVSHGLSAVCCFFWPGIFSLSFCLRVKFCTRERITWTNESVAPGCNNYIPQYTDVFDINEMLLWIKFSNHRPSYMVLWVTVTYTRATSAF